MYSYSQPTLLHFFHPNRHYSFQYKSIYGRHMITMQAAINAMEGLHIYLKSSHKVSSIKYFIL